MRKLLNTLYITNEDAYLALDGETVVVSNRDEMLGRVPLHNIEAIVCFSYVGASPALMGKCAEQCIELSFLKPSGAYLARVTGKTRGNILLRREQYRIADTEERLSYAKNFIFGKMYNSKMVLERAKRDYPLRVDTEQLSRAIDKINSMIKLAEDAKDCDQLRGYEGDAANAYFSVMNELILQQKEAFVFNVRSKRPPLDRVNALLSFSYALLTSMCTSALETVGLDPYAGFMHTDRPGRASLALDLMEELRSVLCDRFVLTLINKKIVSASDFIEKENGTILMTDETRKEVLKQWQNRKLEEITHPFLKEKMPWGLIPYVQALLLARAVRGDIDVYPPYFWR